MLSVENEMRSLKEEQIALQKEKEELECKCGTLVNDIQKLQRDKDALMPLRDSNERMEVCPGQ